MKKLFLNTAFCMFCMMNMQAQEFFTDKRPVQSANEFTRKVNDISYDIDVIIKKNKDLLKEELNEIDKKVEANTLTSAEADALRKEKAEFYAKEIENATKLQEDKIKTLINNKIEDNINFSSDMSAYQKQLIENKSLFYVKYALSKNIMLVENDQDYYKKNGAVTGFGIGFGVKTRLGKDLSRVYWNSSLDVSYQTYKLNDNKTIESLNGTTNLVDIGFPAKKSNLQMGEFRLGNYIEYDFSKRKADEFGNTIVKSRQSFFVGAGGFIGYTGITKALQYEKNGELYTESTQGKYNVNNFTYGIGGYFGYKFVNIEVSYNLNQVFKKSFANQNTLNVSLVFNLM